SCDSTEVRGSTGGGLGGWATGDGWLSASGGDESAASRCRARYDATSAAIPQTTASATVARADRRLRRRLIRADSVPPSSTSTASSSLKPDEIGRGRLAPNASSGKRSSCRGA